MYQSKKGFPNHFKRYSKNGGSSGFREGQIYSQVMSFFLAARTNISSLMPRKDYKEPIPLVIFIKDDAHEKFYALPNGDF